MSEPIRVLFVSTSNGDELEQEAADERVFTDLAERIRQFVLIAERQRPVTLA